MMKALLAGASVVVGMTCSEMNVNATMVAMCTTNASCTYVPPSCSRTNPLLSANGTVCSTPAGTCVGDMCGAGTSLTDSKTCSMCGDTCKGSTETVCSAAWARNGTCTWSYGSCSDPYVPPPTPAKPCMSATKGPCIAESGCNWVQYSSTLCSKTIMTGVTGMCSQCNMTWTPAVRSAINALKLKTCTWAAAGGYQASSITITDIAQSTADLVACPAYTMPTAMDANTALTTAARDGNFHNSWKPFDGTTNAVCTAASNDAASLIPSLAVLGLIAVMVA